MLKHLRAARDEYKARQKFVKENIIHSMGKSVSYTLCGLSVYQWEEYSWDMLPIADSDKEISCKKCLAAMKAENK